MPIKQRQRKAEDTKILFENWILPGLLLRRTKEGRAADLALAPRTLSVRRDALDDIEEDLYKSVYTETLEEFDGYVQRNALRGEHGRISGLAAHLQLVWMCFGGRWVAQNLVSWYLSGLASWWLSCNGWRLDRRGGSPGDRIRVVVVLRNSGVLRG
ncbi:hypothetical protein Droror1_Dr00004242 [Drosera rotundifolia]